MLAFAQGLRIRHKVGLAETNLHEGLMDKGVGCCYQSRSLVGLGKTQTTRLPLLSSRSHCWNPYRQARLHLRSHPPMLRGVLDIYPPDRQATSSLSYSAPMLLEHLGLLHLRSR